MKAVITGDWHIGLNTHGVFDPGSGMNTRLLDIYSAASEIIVKAKQMQASHFLHLGDLFHNNHPTPTEIAVAQDFINDLSKSGIKTYIISGNHDYVHGNKLDPLEMFARQIIPGVEFCSDPCIKEEEDVRLVIIPHCPYTKITEFISEASLPQDGKLNVLLCHTTFTGAQVGSEDRMMAAGVTMLRQELNVHVVFSGHIHKPQKLVSAYSGRADVYYPGSPIQMDFAERNDQKEFLVLSSTGTMYDVQSVPIKSGRKLIQIETCDYNQWGDVSNAIVRVVVPKDRAIGWTADDFETALKDRGVFKVASVKIIDSEQQAAIEKEVTSKSDQELMWGFLQEKLGSLATEGWYEAQEVLADVQRSSSK